VTSEHRTIISVRGDARRWLQPDGASIAVQVTTHARSAAPALES